MAELTRVGDIDVPQDLRAEGRSFRLRRLFNVVFALLLVAGLLGLLGRSGVLSETSASDGGLTVEYERFLRVKSPTEIRVRIASGAGSTDVAISQGLLDGLRVEGYSAEPERTRVLPDRVVHTFEQRPPSEITVRLEPQRPGLHRGTVHGPGDATVPVTQWAWP